MIKKKKKKLPTLRKLITTADAIASRIVRKRDGWCVMCGKTENLQAHHYVITKARSTKHRWNLKNLVTLCWHCHLHLCHSTQTCLRITETLKKAVIMNKIATEEEIEQIKNDTELITATRAFLEQKIEELKKIEEEQQNATK